MEIGDAQLQVWLQAGLFPLARIGGVFTSAPVLGDRSAPARVRLMLALALTLIVMPLMPDQPLLAAFSADWWLRMFTEILLGIMMGFVLKLVFEAVVLGGELIGNSMGLGFARMADPLRGTDVPVVGQFLHLMAALLFIALGGHLQLIELLVGSFKAVPDAGAVLQATQFKSMAELGITMFSGAMLFALPMLAALLLVNLAFGMMSRSAPTLNGMSVGFPLALAVGLVLLRVDLQSLRQVFTQQLQQAWTTIALISGQGG